MEGFPNEIPLHIFSFLPLKSLITGRTVSQEWRRLVLLADITPIRRALLDFYLTLIDSPIFLLTRPWVLVNLQPFDRQKYIDDLLDQHPYLPEAFRVWILEWPAKAVIGCVWPGLPNIDCWLDEDNVHRIRGANWLAPLPPTISALLFQKHTRDPSLIPALFIFHHPATWLMLDERESLRGKVYTLADGGISDVYDELSTAREGGQIDDDWIGWQKRTWDEIEATAEWRIQTNKIILRLEDMWEYKEPDTPRRIPAYPWRRRDDPIIKSKLKACSVTESRLFC